MYIFTGKHRHVAYYYISEAKPRPKYYVNDIYIYIYIVSVIVTIFPPLMVSFFAQCWHTEKELSLINI